MPKLSKKLVQENLDFASYDYILEGCEADYAAELSKLYTIDYDQWKRAYYQGNKELIKSTQKLSKSADKFVEENPGLSIPQRILTTTSYNKNLFTIMSKEIDLCRFPHTEVRLLKSFILKLALQHQQKIVLKDLPNDVLDVILSLLYQTVVPINVHVISNLEDPSPLIGQWEKRFQRNEGTFQVIHSSQLEAKLQLDKLKKNYETLKVSLTSIWETREKCEKQLIAQTPILHRALSLPISTTESQALRKQIKEITLSQSHIQMELSQIQTSMRKLVSSVTENFSPSGSHSSRFFDNHRNSPSQTQSSPESPFSTSRP